MVPGGATDPGAHGEDERSLSPVRKLGLTAIVLYDFLVVTVGLRRKELAPLVRELRATPHLRLRPLRPARLGRIVDRVLRLGSHRPRCLLLSLVLFRLLRRQDTPSELVIGLAPEARDHEAHAWVEVGGEDVGPPPGRLGHSALARYGDAGPRAGT